jgi:orotidine-5'-phosphate decarboxylase
MIGFRARLAKRQVEANTRVCVGLDPLVEKMPERFNVGESSRNVLFWMKFVVDATAPYASMFKPQSAHWESLPNGKGVEALKELMEYIHQKYPDIPVFLDCKRGDIARTQKQYGIAHLLQLGADGMNFSPYMGKDTMAALVLVNKDSLGKALVGLCYTSNPDARQVQDAPMADGRPSWQHYAEWILQWAEELGVVADAGLVMAAAYELPPKGSKKIYLEHLTQCRKIVGNKMWFLIPGVGTQQGAVDETVRAADAGPGSFAINSSSDIIFSDDPAAKAKALRDDINLALGA